MSEKYTLKRPIYHVSLNNDDLIKGMFDGGYKITEKIMVRAVDMIDKLITDEIIRIAEEAGVTELYLPDKQFIAEAIREKMEREQVVKDCSTCGEEYRDLHFYPCCACHNTAPVSMSKWHPKGTEASPMENPQHAIKEEEKRRRREWEKFMREDT